MDALLDPNSKIRIFSKGNVTTAKEYSSKKSDPYYTVFNQKGIQSLGISYWDKKTSVDLDLLKRAHASFNISPDIEDYVLAPVDIIGTYSPNSNAMTFVPDQLLGYSTVYGMENWKTFRGKAVFVNHEPKDMNPIVSKGIILDAKVIPVPNTRYHRIHILKAVDRTKDEKLAKGVLSGKINTASMSAYPDFLFCSLCKKPSFVCKCKQWGKLVKQGKGKHLVNLIIVNPLFVESSFLPEDNPADKSALTTRKPFLITDDRKDEK